MADLSTDAISCVSNLDFLLVVLLTVLMVVAVCLTMVLVASGGRRSFKTRTGRVFIVEEKNGRLVVTSDGPMFVQWYQGHYACEVIPLE